MSTLIGGKRVLVTAGGSGIGRAIVDRFIAAGAHVHTCDVQKDFLKEVVSTNERVTASLADVGVPGEVETLVADAVDAMGGVDVLINNAGIGGPTAALEDISYADWDRTIGVNLNGMFYCIKNVAPHMKAQGSGCIVNISTASAKVSLPQRSPYVASKVGVLGLTHTVAREYGPFGIRCNTISPGAIATPIFWGGSARANTLTDDHNAALMRKLQANLARATPMGKSGLAEDIANAALYLASDDGRFVNSHDLVVDGGRTSLFIDPPAAD